jgi:co-chaperonin GroES (HSP10)
VWVGEGEYRERRDVLLVHENSILGTEKDGKLVAMNDAVIVSRKKPGTMTAGGLHIPETAQKVTNDGIVFAQGPGPWGDDECNRLPMRTKVGEHVFWQDYAPTPHESLERFAPPGHELAIIKRNEPLMVREPDPT